MPGHEAGDGDGHDRRVTGLLQAEGRGRNGVLQGARPHRQTDHAPT